MAARTWPPTWSARRTGRSTAPFSGDRDIRDELYTLVIGSIDSTTSALVWGLDYLARNPAQRERLEREIDEVLGSRPLEGGGLQPTSLRAGRVQRDCPSLAPILRQHVPLAAGAGGLPRRRLPDSEGEPSSRPASASCTATRPIGSTRISSGRNGGSRIRRPSTRRTPISRS